MGFSVPEKRELEAVKGILSNWKVENLESEMELYELLCLCYTI